MVDFNPNGLEVGLHDFPKMVYMCFKKLPAGITLKQQEKTLTELDIYTASFHFENVGVLFALKKNFEIISRRQNHLVIDASCGEGTVFWCQQGSVHSSVSHTIFVTGDLRYDTET